MLNTGFKANGSFSRCVGANGTSLAVVDFSTFCPKAIAGIADYAEQWLASREHGAKPLAPQTLKHYRMQLRVNIAPTIGHRPVSALTADDVAHLIIVMQRRGLTGSTIRNALKVVNGTLKRAKRRGIIATIPTQYLDSDERPRVTRRPPRILTAAEIDAALAHADDEHRTLLTAAVYSGLRVGELLALQWREIDFDHGEIHVREQVYDRQRRPLKTPESRRDVSMGRKLAQMLRLHKAASRWSTEADYVFTFTGGPMHSRTVEKALDRAVTAAAKAIPTLAEDGMLTFHHLRHTFASLLIALELRPEEVAAQLGHKDAYETLKTYTHLFRKAESAQRVRDAIDAAMG